MNEQVLESVVDTILQRVHAAGAAGTTRDEVFEAVRGNITVARFEQTIEAMVKGQLVRCGRGGYVLFPYRDPAISTEPSGLFFGAQQ